MKTPILGGSYVARSVNAADNRMVNLFPEIIPEGGKEPAFLQRCPGLAYLATLPDSPVRGMWVVGSLLYVAAGTSLVSVDSSYTIINLGTISGTTEQVSMSDNGLQVFISCNNSPTYDAYVYTIATTTLTQVTDMDFPGSGSVCFLDGYFAINVPGTQKIYVSALYDGLSWDALDFASAEASPDNVVGIIADHGELWIFGESTTEVWTNQGLPGFPFAPIQGAFSEVGCASANSIAKINNQVFWLGKDARGQGIVYTSRGYSPERVSTHAVEWQIQQFNTDLSGAIAYTYQQDGHIFYLISFTGENTTWCYDTATQSWHERQSVDVGNPSEYGRHWGVCQAFFNNVTVIGTYFNGDLYKFDLNVFSDNTIYNQRWVRSWRALTTGQNNLKRTAQHSLQLDIESGTGPSIDPNQTVTLRWSDDGGHTWSNNHTLGLGDNGDYSKRIIWRRLGMTMKLRDRVYEVSGVDPAAIYIMGAELIMSPTNA